VFNIYKVMRSYNGDVRGLTIQRLLFDINTFSYQDGWIVDKRRSLLLYSRDESVKSAWAGIFKARLSCPKFQTLALGHGLAIGVVNHSQRANPPSRLLHL